MNLLLVIIGFSLIIVVHELGHFLAARWAGIRVLAFGLVGWWIVSALRGVERARVPNGPTTGR